MTTMTQEPIDLTEQVNAAPDVYPVPVLAGSDDDAEDWYHRALTLSESDLRATLREETGSDPVDEDAEELAQTLRTAARKIETPHADKAKIVRNLAWLLLGRLADDDPDASGQLDGIAAWALSRRKQIGEQQ